MYHDASFECFDTHAAAINAVGIGNAIQMRRVRVGSDPDRYEQITDAAGGFIGLADDLASAGEAMERFRIKVGWESEWGGDLPHVYHAWAAIAELLWKEWGNDPATMLTERALIHLVMQSDPNWDADVAPATRTNVAREVKAPARRISVSSANHPAKLAEKPHDHGQRKAPRK